MLKIGRRGMVERGQGNVIMRGVGGWGPHPIQQFGSKIQFPEPRVLLPQRYKFIGGSGPEPGDKPVLMPGDLIVYSIIDSSDDFGLYNIQFFLFYHFKNVFVIPSSFDIFRSVCNCGSGIELNVVSNLIPFVRLRYFILINSSE